MKSYNLVLDNGITVHMTLDETVTTIANEVTKYEANLSILSTALTQTQPGGGAAPWPSAATTVSSYSEVS